MRIQFLPIILFSVICFLSAPADVLAQHAGKVPPPSPLQKSFPGDEEYAVYSALLDALYGGKNAKSLVIEKEVAGCTSTGNNAEGEKARQQNLARLPEKLPGLKAATVADFRTKERQCMQLESRLNSKAGYTLIARAERTKIFSQKDPRKSWAGFYRKYPGSIGYINLSSAGFSEDRSQALVETFMKCGGGCGSNHFVMLAKKNGQWIVASTLKVWEMTAAR